MLERLIKEINKHEKFFAGAIIILVVLASLLPIIHGLWVAGPEDKFFGAPFIDQPDYPVYLSMIEQSRQGHWLFANLYTAESQSRIFFSPLWLVLGKLNQIFGGSAIFWYYFARTLASIGFLYFLYWFLKKIFSRSVERLAALALLGFSSGLGWLFLPLEKTWDIYTIFYKVPVDFWVAESNTFLSLCHSALFPLSQFLIVAIFYLFLQPFNRRRGLILALATLFLGILHPYDLVTAGAAPLAYLAFDWFRKRKVDWSKVKAYLVILVFAGLAGSYYLIITYFDWVMGQWALSNFDPSPPIASYIVGYGLALAFAIVGASVVIKNRNEKFYFFIIWAVVASLLLYAPLSIQRRLVNGLHLPLVILAVVALAAIGRSLKKREIWFYLLVSFLGLGFFISNISLIVVDWSDYSQKKFPRMISASYYQASKWLENNASSSEAILADVAAANIIPGLTGRDVYAGHSHQTVNFLAKRDLLENWFFFNNIDDAQKELFLRQNNISYLWYSAQEKKLGRFNPAEKSYLEPVYSNSEVIIYRLK